MSKLQGMSARKLDWKRATVDPRGEMEVPIEPPPDDEWIAALNVAARRRQDDVRGQVYRRTEVSGSFLIMEGVDEKALTQTADFLDAVIEQANKELVRTREDRAKQMHERAQHAQVDEAAAQRATELLRQRA
jgi:hypothetical protein